MTDKITLTNIANLQNETTVVNAINANNAVITTAMDNTLSRDGTAPNQMVAPLDMNSNQILNLPAPSSNSSPLRLIDATTLNGGGTLNVINIPSGGTTGQELVKNSNTNYDVKWSSTKQVPTGGATGSSLIKNSNSDNDVTWGFPSSAGVASWNTRTGAVVSTPLDLTLMTGYYAGMQPIKRTDINLYSIGINPGSFSAEDGGLGEGYGGYGIYQVPPAGAEFGLVCDLSTGTINTGVTPFRGCCLSPGALAATTAYDGTDFMLYIVKRNSDNGLALVAHNANAGNNQVACTINNGSSTWNTVGGVRTSFWNGTKTRLSVTGGSLPTGFNNSTDYFVVGETNGRNSTSFQLSTSYGGSPITATSPSSGTIECNFGPQTSLDALYGVNTWTVLRRVHFAWRWKWQWPGTGGGIPDFQADMRGDRIYLNSSSGGGPYGSTAWQANTIPSSGLATSPTTIDLSANLSNLNRVVAVRAAVVSTGSSGTCYVGQGGNSVAIASVPATGGFLNYGYAEINTDTNNGIQYYVTGGAQLSNIWVEGWTFSDPS